MPSEDETERGEEKQLIDAAGGDEPSDDDLGREEDLQKEEAGQEFSDEQDRPGSEPDEQLTEKGGSDPDKDEAEVGDNDMSGEQPGQPGDMPREEDLNEDVASDTAREFDQLGEGPDPDAETGEQTPAFSDEVGMLGAGYNDEVMEQWLERVEGDPGVLMRSQFMLNERRQWEESGGRLVEPRPW